jgi:trimeric autotransporter adhesin
MHVRIDVLCKIVWYLLISACATVYAQAPLSPGTLRPLGQAKALCNGPITAMLRASDGDFWVAGVFNECAGQPRFGIARFRNEVLVPQALPFVSGQIQALAEYQGAIYVGGRGFELGNERGLTVLRIRADSFETIGAAPDQLSQTSEMLVFENALYIAGNNRLGAVLRWDGTTLVGIPGLPFGNGRNARTLAVHDGSLYVGGGFPSCLQKLVNGQWQTLSGGSIAPCDFDTSSQRYGVYALASYNGALVIGGSFNQAGAVATQNIAQWRDGQFEPLVAGANNGVADANQVVASVSALAVFQNKLFLGGQFQSAGGNAAENIAVYDGTNYRAISAGGANGVIGKLYPDGNRLLLTGGFSFIGDSAIPQAASWNGTRYQPALPLLSASEGPDNVVTKLTTSVNGLLAIGRFRTMANVRALGMAQLTDGQWQTLPGIAPSDGVITGSVLINGERIIVGSFQRIGNTVVNYSARYRNGGWETLGAGGDRSDLEVAGVIDFKGSAYLAGRSFRINNQDCFSLARWDGQQLRCTGAPFLSPALASAMIVHDGHLYVSVGAANYTYDGTQWRQIDNQGLVNSFAVHRGQLYASGPSSAFSTSTIQRWDGSQWHAVGLEDFRACVGTLFPCTQFKLASYQNQLYALNTAFTLNGQLSAYDGRHWRTQALLTGNTTNEIAVYNGLLYLSGGSSGEFLSTWEAPLDSLFADGVE